MSGIVHWHGIAISGVTVCSLILGNPTLAHQPPVDLQRLGKVDFKVDCNAAAQKEFNRGMALYHSFAWPAAMDSFETVLKADPTCGMAHWGKAVTTLDNPFVWPANLPAQKLNDIGGMLEAARQAGLKTEREKGYVEAVAVFVKDHDKLNHRTRLESFDSAMQKLAAADPRDIEATVLSALVTSANFDPTDKTYGNQLKAARKLEPLFKAYPKHPGVAHYLIHSYDYPPIAKYGLNAAKLYVKIAPDATHALHMPSHIFTRLGSWQDSIDANRASEKSSTEKTFDGHHAHDYMVYAHLQLAQDSAAAVAIRQSQAKPPVDHFASAFAYAAMPARLALERSDWQAAAALTLAPAGDYPWKKYPQAESINAFAKGIGWARLGDAAKAREQQVRLTALSSQAKEMKLGYWAEQIAIQADVVEALGLCAETKSDACIASLRKAADREDATEKHVVTPGPLVPAREVLAEMLLSAKKPVDALKEYEAVLKKEPNRYRAVSGAMLAARDSGNKVREQALARQLLALGVKADPGRESLTQARQLLKLRVASR